MNITNKSGIYIIKNAIDSRVYIGSAVNLAVRKGTHFSQLRNNKHHNSHLQNFANKYGINSLIFDVLEFCEKTVLLEREQYYFTQYENRFNLCEIAGNSLNRKFSTESKIKISESLKKAGLKGIPKSENTKKAMRKPKTKEHSDKIKLAQKSVIKTVYQYDFNFNLINTFESLSETAKKTNFNRQQISACCNNKKQNSVKGFIFTFCEINNLNIDFYKEKLKRTFKNTQNDIKETWQ